MDSYWVFVVVVVVVVVVFFFSFLVVAVSLSIEPCLSRCNIGLLPKTNRKRLGQTVQQTARFEQPLFKDEKLRMLYTVDIQE